MSKVIGWIDDRFPLMKMWNEHLEEFQLLVFLRVAGAAGAGDPDRFGHLPGDALQTRC